MSNIIRSVSPPNLGESYGVEVNTNGGSSRVVLPTAASLSPTSPTSTVNMRAFVVDANRGQQQQQQRAKSTTTASNRPRLPSVTGPPPPSSVETTPVSEFNICRMPRDQIIRRTLYPWSVHCCGGSGNNAWIATISRPDPSHPNKVRHLQFNFPTEREGRKFCKAYSPPRLKGIGGGNGVMNNKCMLCPSKITMQRNCRNCGALVCERCSRRWGLRMVPKTYHTGICTAAQTVRVCKSCDWLSNAFCMALLQGRYEDALILYDTGNVNLRTCFADIHKEAMFPVHCAVIGGSYELLKWLVDTHECPISVLRSADGQKKSVQTSASRTLIDLAMTGRPKVDILMFLVRKGLSIEDVKDPTLAPKTLESILRAGIPLHFNTPLKTTDHLTLPPPQDVPMMVDMDESVTTTIEDMCALCCEKPMDCVMIPCGHQICCTECAAQLQTCPVCKVECSVLKIFRQ